MGVKNFYLYKLFGNAKDSFLKKRNRPEVLLQQLCAEIFETDLEKRTELLLWQNVLNRIEERKIGWEPFLASLKGPLLSHPAARIAATREGQTLLHLAVLDERLEIVRELSPDVRLQLRRNRYGLTPLELAQFLNKKTCAELLSPKSPSRPLPQIPPSIPIEYLAHPIFETSRLLEDILRKTQRAKLSDEIPPEKIWMGVYFDKEIQSGIHPPVAIQLVDQEVGYGVFAKKKIAPCGYVGEYTGIIQERKRKHLKEKVYCVRYTVWEAGRKNYVIDAEQKGNFTRFINHSSKPNLGLQSVYWRGVPRMIFIALKEIPEGAQLTFDYGALFWKECPQMPRLFE